MDKHCKAAFIKHELAGLYIPVKPIVVVLDVCETCLFDGMLIRYGMIYLTDDPMERGPGNGMAEDKER